MRVVTDDFLFQIAREPFVTTGGARAILSASLPSSSLSPSSSYSSSSSSSSSLLLLLLKAIAAAPCDRVPRGLVRTIRFAELDCAFSVAFHGIFSYRRIIVASLRVSILLHRSHRSFEYYT